MEQTLEQYRRSCGITVIAECGAAVDYSLHEVIEAVDTKDAALNKTVASVYRPGYCYKGTVKKKAQVSAYRTAT